MSDDDRQHSAADDPTAMFDADALREAGMDDVDLLAQLRPEASEPAPATEAKRRRDEPSIQVRTGAGPVDPRAGRPAQRASGVSWALTIGLAVGLGLGVYFLVRFLR